MKKPLKTPPVKSTSATTKDRLQYEMFSEDEADLLPEEILAEENESDGTEFRTPKSSIKTTTGGLHPRDEDDEFEDEDLNDDVDLDDDVDLEVNEDTDEDVEDDYEGVTPKSKRKY